MKITKVTKIQPGIHGHVCPLCNSIHASANEPMYLPEFSTCDCDRNGNKLPTYELFKQGNKTMIRRTKTPRFIAEITFGQLSDIENIDWVDDPKIDAMELARVMSTAAEFLRKVSRNE